MIRTMRNRCLIAAGLFFVCAGMAHAQTTVTLSSVTGGELSFDITGTYFIAEKARLGAIHIEYRIKGSSNDWTDGGTVENPGPEQQPFEETVEVATADTYEVRLKLVYGGPDTPVYSDVKEVEVFGVGGGGP